METDNCNEVESKTNPGKRMRVTPKHARSGLEQLPTHKSTQNQRKSTRKWGDKTTGSSVQEEVMDGVPSVGEWTAIHVNKLTKENPELHGRKYPL